MILSMTFRNRTDRQNSCIQPGIIGDFRTNSYTETNKSRVGEHGRVGRPNASRTKPDATGE